jgi:hypothetical protein
LIADPKSALVWFFQHLLGFSKFIQFKKRNKKWKKLVKFILISSNGAVTEAVDEQPLPG